MRAVERPYDRYALAKVGSALEHCSFHGYSIMTGAMKLLQANLWFLAGIVFVARIVILLHKLAAYRRFHVPGGPIRTGVRPARLDIDQFVFEAGGQVVMSAD